MGEVERLRRMLRDTIDKWSLAIRQVAHDEFSAARCKRQWRNLDALIAAVREERDREWLSEFGSGDCVRNKDGTWWAPANSASDVALQMGYEPDGAGGWKRLIK